MTQHLDEGTLRRHLDGELPPGEVAAVQVHLAACGACARALEELEHAERVASGALALLAVELPSPHRARAAVLARLEGTRSPVRPAPASPPVSPLFPSPEPRRPGGAPRMPGWMRLAAALLLGAVGVGASTLPGSPLREWMEGRGAPGVEAPATAGTLASTAGGGEVAVFVAPEAGGVRIDLAGLRPGAEVRLVLVEEGSVGVRVLDGARFETAPGRIHVVVEEGGVRIDVPRTLRTLAVWGNGERYTAGAPESLELLGPNAVRQGDTVVFVVDDRSPDLPR